MSLLQQEKILLEQIQQKVNNLWSEGMPNFRMKLTIQTDKGKKYKTTFNVEKNKNETTTYISVRNNCILIVKSFIGGLTSRIEANSPQNQTSEEGICFSPLLVSNAIGTEGRITSTDVLQVLKTKLSIAMFSQTSLVLKDEATIQNVPVTPFRMLRGGNPIYEKYGYKNPRIPALKEFIKTLTVDYLEYEYNGNCKEFIGKTYYEILFDVFKKERLDNEEPLTKAFRMITLEEESKRIPDFSSSFFFELLLEFDDDENEDDVDEAYTLYALDWRSPEWNAWEKRIIITGVEFEEFIKGGRRKTRKTRRRKTRRN